MDWENEFDNEYHQMGHHDPHRDNCSIATS